MENNKKREVYLVGAGIASLASAAYLIRDGKMAGTNIHILEESGQTGGSMDAHGSAEKGYTMRGGRMFDEEAYTCTYDLLSFIPQTEDPAKSVKEGMFEFNEKVTSHSLCRLVENGKKVDVSSMGFSMRDRLDLIKILMLSEDSLGISKIDDHFEGSFFTTNFIFKSRESGQTVERLVYTQQGKRAEIEVLADDLVFVTIGSMTEGSSFGSMTKAPVLESKRSGGAWALWENIAKNKPEFGDPLIFDDHIAQSAWESFTITFHDPTFFRLMEAFTGNEAGTGGLVTFKDSNWLMSLVLPFQPHYIGQPAGVQVCWGYGLFPYKQGNFVHKKMSECNGDEILREIFGHLRFTKDQDLLLKTSICIPCMLPFITSQFLVRGKTDRPPVIPKGSTNLAFIGQYWAYRRWRMTWSWSMRMNWRIK
jgi:oleate hydratase